MPMIGRADEDSIDLFTVEQGAEVFGGRNFGFGWSDMALVATGGGDLVIAHICQGHQLEAGHLDEAAHEMAGPAT